MTTFAALTGSVEKVGEHIPLLRCSPCYDEKLYKLRITFSAEAYETDSFVHTAAKLMHVVPATPPAT